MKLPQIEEWDTRESLVTHLKSEHSDIEISDKVPIKGREMSRDHSWNQRSGGSTRSRNRLEIILLILIGLMIFILAYQVITHRGRSDAVKFGHNETRVERTKLLFNVH
jgi:hypothetical protein